MFYREAMIYRTVLLCVLFFPRMSSAQPRWRVLNSGVLNGFLGVAATDTLNVWAVGGQRTILHTTDGGVTWFRQIPSQLDTFFRDVSFSDGNHGWAVGSTNYSPRGIVHRTTNGGNTWRLQYVFPDSGQTCRGVSFPDTLRGWLTLFKGNVTYMGRIYRTSDGGSAWALLDSFPFITYSVFFRDTLHGWVTTSDTAWLSTKDGGRTWERDTIPLSKQQQDALFFVDTLFGWGGLPLIRTTDGGKRWLLPSVGPNGGVEGVSFLNRNTGWGGGDRFPSGDAIWRTTDGGNSWTLQSEGLTGSNIYDLVMTDTVHGWAVGAGGYIYGYGDSGTGVEGERRIGRNKGIGLTQSTPNPFSQQVFIRYTVAETGRVKLKIYDLSGRLVRSLVDEVKPIGEYRIAWNGRDDRGRKVPSGEYFYQVEASGRVLTKKLITVR